MPPGKRGRDRCDASQVGGRAREGLGYGEQRVVPDDAEGGPVQLRAERLAPAVQLAQRRELSRR